MVIEKMYFCTVKRASDANGVIKVNTHQEEIAYAKNWFSVF